MIENAFNKISELISWLNARTEEYNIGRPTVSDEDPGCLWRQYTCPGARAPLRGLPRR